jgi:hypothetical protein
MVRHADTNAGHFRALPLPAQGRFLGPVEARCSLVEGLAQVRAGDWLLLAADLALMVWGIEAAYGDAVSCGLRQ